MSGILGALLLLAAAFSANELPWGGPYLGAAVTGFLLLLASLGLFRSWSKHKVRQLDLCTTCRGVGTVYSAEFNDWSKPGPVRTIRELCPACEGIRAPSVR